MNPGDALASFETRHGRRTHQKAPALGRITRTTVAAVQSSGPVSFIAGADGAVIRPLDYVPGYVVPDGQPARDMSDRLSDGGLVFPGPDLNHIWVESDDNGHTTMVLVSLNGRVRQQRVTIPEGVFPVADGAGYLLLVGTHSIDDAAAGRPAGRPRRVSTGSLVATCPTGWLVVECDPSGGARPLRYNGRMVPGTSSARRLTSMSHPASYRPTEPPRPCSTRGQPAPSRYL